MVLMQEQERLAAEAAAAEEQRIMEDGTFVNQYEISVAKNVPQEADDIYEEHKRKEVDFWGNGMSSTA